MYTYIEQNSLFLSFNIFAKIYQVHIKILKPIKLIIFDLIYITIRKMIQVENIICIIYIQNFEFHS